MTLYARVQDGIVQEIIDLPPGQRITDLFHSDLVPQFVAVPHADTSRIRSGWRYDGSAFGEAPPMVAAPVVPRFLPASTLRERMEAVGRWDEMAALLAGLMSKQPGLVFRLLTLSEGIDPQDQQTRALIAEAGANPDDILRTGP
jgi:hypothetical protein